MATRLPRLLGAIREISAIAAIAVLSVMLTAFSTVAAAAGGPKSIALGDPTAANDIRGLPDNVPRDYVVTPNGFFHPSCVQRIESDETLRADGAIVRADGSSRRVPICAYPHFAADGTELAADAVPFPAGAPASDPPQINGWVAYASYTLARANASVYIASNMSVPTAPNVHSGQVVYFFPGLEDAQHVQTIVQPCLAGTRSTTAAGPSRAGTAASAVRRGIARPSPSTAASRCSVA